MMRAPRRPRERNKSAKKNNPSACIAYRCLEHFRRQQKRQRSAKGKKPATGEKSSIRHRRKRRKRHNNVPAALLPGKLPEVIRQVSRKDLMCLELRRLQCKTGCSTNTLNLALNVIAPYLKFDPARVQRADSLLKKLSGATVIRLHGCVGRHCSHVFGPDDPAVHCPRCGTARYDHRDKPKEVLYYFPIKETLRKLLQLPAFRNALQHEWRRPKNPNYMTDVFDSPRWVELMGPATRVLRRLGLLYCVDGIPAFKPGGLSLKPSEFMILNLPPWERCKPENMLLHMLFPAKLKGLALKKYYDWAATFELNELAVHGIEGVKIKHFGTSLDTPGRSEILCMEASQAYQGCPHCFHAWDRGPVRKPLFNGARRFLSETSPRREREFVEDGQTYMYKDAERRPTPSPRTTQSAADCSQRATNNKPFCGHKGDPLQNRWPGFSWSWSICEWMHDVKCVCDFCLRVLVGNYSSGMYKKWKTKDATHRRQCEVFLTK